MAKDADITDVEDGTDKPIPSIEDVMKASNWDDRIAKARQHREKVLAKNGPIARPPVPPRTPALAKTDADDPSEDLSKDLEDAPSIDEILTTANWSERLEKAKERRQEILAKRNEAKADKIATAKKIVAKQEKETIRLAVTGFRRDAPVSEDKPQEKSKVTTFAPLPAVAEEKTENVAVAAVAVDQDRRSKWPIAAGIALVALAGGWVAKPYWSPIQVAQTDVPAVGTSAEPAIADSGAATETAVTTAALPAEAAVPETAAAFDVASIAPAPLLPVHGNTDNGSNAPVIVANVSPRVSATTNLAAPTGEAAPNLQVTPPVIRPDQVTFASDNTQKPVAPLGVAPDYLDTVSTLSASSDGTTGTPPVLGDVQVASVGQQQSTPRPAMVPAPSDTGNALAVFQRPDLANGSLSTVPAVMPEFARAFNNPTPTDFGSGLGSVGHGAQDAFEPTAITFLSGPAPSDIPVSTLPELALSPIASARDVSATLNVPQDFRALDASLPTPLTETARLASLGSIPEGLTQDPIATVPAMPEPFEDMVARIGVSPTIRATVPAENGLSLDVTAYSIHVQAPAGLSEDKVTQFSDALRHTGFVVKPPTRVGYKISKNNIRYYHAEDAEAAKVLAEAVEGSARDFTDFRPSPPLGTIEVFLAGTSPKSSAKPAQRKSTAPATNPEVTALRNRLLNSLRRGDHL